MKVGFVPRELDYNSFTYLKLVGFYADSGSSRRGRSSGILDFIVGITIKIISNRLGGLCGGPSGRGGNCWQLRTMESMVPAPILAI